MTIKSETCIQNIEHHYELYLYVWSNFHGKRDQWPRGVVHDLHEIESSTAPTTMEDKEQLNKYTSV